MALAAAAIAVSAIGTAVSAASAMAQGEAAQQAGNYNAQIAAQKANESMAASSRAVSMANIQAQQKRTQANRFAAEQRVGFLRAGVALSGSANDVLSDTATQGNLQAASTEYAGLMDSYNLRSGARDLQAQSELDIAAGSNARSAGFMDAGSSLLSGAGNAMAISVNPNFR